METYNPILRASQPIMKRGIGIPRHRPPFGIAYVLLGHDTAPIVLERGRRLSLRDSVLGGYTEAFTVDVSMKRLEWTDNLPCLGEAHHFAARLELTCRVTDPLTVVRQNIQDAGRVLWSAVTRHARVVSRQHSLDQTSDAEQAITDHLAGVALHPAFRTRAVEVSLSPDPQAVEIRRRTTNMTFWNSLFENPVVAAYVADHPGDMVGALEVFRKQLEQLEDAVKAVEDGGGRISRSDMRAMNNELLERTREQMGLRGRAAISADGRSPVLPPQELPDTDDEEEPGDLD